VCAPSGDTDGLWTVGNDVMLGNQLTGTSPFPLGSLDGRGS